MNECIPPGSFILFLEGTWGVSTELYLWHGLVTIIRIAAKNLNKYKPWQPVFRGESKATLENLRELINICKIGYANYKAYIMLGVLLSKMTSKT